MQTFENTVTIQRPAGEVFAFLADFENIPKWNYAIEDTTKFPPGPSGWAPGTARPVRCRAGAPRASR